MLKRQFDSSVSNRNLLIIGRLCLHQFDSLSGIRLGIPIQFRNRGICIAAVDSDTTFSPQKLTAKIDITIINWPAIDRELKFKIQIKK